MGRVYKDWRNTFFGVFSVKVREIILMRNGLARRVYWSITALFTIVVAVFGYLYTGQQREMLTQRKIYQLTGAAVALEQQLNRRDLEELARGAQTASPFTDAALALASRYQPVLDSVASRFPGYCLGVFSRQHGGVVAKSAGLAEALPLEQYPAEVWKVYESGGIEASYLPSVPQWGGKPVLSVRCPLNLDGQVVGHTWASVKMEEVERQIYATVGKIVLLCFLVWLMSFIAVSMAFGRIVSSSKKLAEEIRQDKENPAAIKEFPELTPILDTVNEMRRRYSSEAQKLKQLMEICPVGIIVIDNYAQVAGANQLMRQKYYELNGKDMLGCSFRSVMEQNGYIFEGSVAARVLRGETIKDHCMALFKDEWLINAVPLIDAETQDICGALIVSQNITDYEKSRTDRQRLDRDHLVSCMATGVAHEIRNPLTVIKGYLQFFRRKTASFEQINIILEELERVELIISDFLTLARNKNTEKQRQNLNEVIRQVYPSLNAEALHQKVELKLDMASNLPDLFVDGKEIKQLVVNLVRNSLEAMGSVRGRIVVATEADGQKVYLRVSDNGCGIPQEEQGRVFDPFYTTKETGTGLGLAVAASIVQRHGGRIEIKSSAGKGTLVIIGFDLSDIAVTA